MPIYARAALSIANVSMFINIVYVYRLVSMGRLHSVYVSVPSGYIIFYEFEYILF